MKAALLMLLLIGSGWVFADQDPQVQRLEAAINQLQQEQQSVYQQFLMSQELRRNELQNNRSSLAGGYSTMGPDSSRAIDYDENLRLQDTAAQRMRNFRHVHGALSLETIEARPIFDGDQIRDLEVEHKNRATDIIEDCMIAANGVTARYLTSKKFPSIRRVVRTPKRWDRIALGA